MAISHNSRRSALQRSRILPLAAVFLSGLVSCQWVRVWLAPGKLQGSPRVARRGIGSAVTDAVETRSVQKRVVEKLMGEFNLEAYMKEKIGRVELALNASLISRTPFNAKIVEAMRYSLMAGGKRIRPVMCLAGYEMIAGGENAKADAEQNAMPLAAAIEMIHTMSLIHDDLPPLDNDDLRRGKPTSHKVYGEDVAILAGDALLSESFAHVARETPKSVPADRVVEVLQRLGDTVGPEGLAGGQVLDLECEAKHSATLEELKWIHVHKTAVLLEMAVVGGAILAGASKEEIAACESYARNIGLAFQVADDILDVTQSSEQLGKTAGKDEATDKTTYVKLLGLEGAREEAERLKAEAVAALEPFGERAAPLLAVADYIVKRTN